MENPGKQRIDLKNIDKRTNIFAFPNWNLEAIENARVLVVGCGALGNEVLKNLALIGVQNIVIMDFDVVERTNLAKSILFREEDCTVKKFKVDIAKERLKEINPDLKIVTINGDVTIDIGLGVFKRMDVIIGCVDNRLTRLWINRFCQWVNKPWIDGGIMDLGGQITVYIPGTSCYECNLSPDAWANIAHRNGCTTRAMRYASAGIANTTPITSSVIGAMQVQEALKLVANPENANTLAGKQFYYQGENNTYEVLPYSTLRKLCKSHQKYDPIIPAPELSYQNTVRETLDWLIDYFKDPELVISLHYLLALSVATGTSEKIIPYIKPRLHIQPRDLAGFQIVEGEDVRIHESTSEIDIHFPYPERRLSDLGIPPLHILLVISKGEKHYIELAGDESFLHFL